MDMTGLSQFVFRGETGNSNFSLSISQIGKRLGARMPRVTTNNYAVAYFDGQQIPCRTLDVSVSGLSLTSPVHRQVGMPLKIEISLGESVGWICIDATLVREENRGASYLWGVRFRNLDYWVREYLSGYLEELAVCSAVA
jgi:hypothetical protein